MFRHITAFANRSRLLLIVAVTLSFRSAVLSISRTVGQLDGIIYYLFVLPVQTQIHYNFCNSMVDKFESP